MPLGPGYAAPLVGIPVPVVGLAVAAGSWWTLPLLVGVLVVMLWGVIRREESYLEARFGDEYVTYKRRVRRWI